MVVLDTLGLGGREYRTIRADEIYRQPTLLFNREGGAVVDVILETVENFRGNFGEHEHTLKNIPREWF